METIEKVPDIKQLALAKVDEIERRRVRGRTADLIACIKRVVGGGFAMEQAITREVLATVRVGRGVNYGRIVAECGGMLWSVFDGDDGDGGAVFDDVFFWWEERWHLASSLTNLGFFLRRQGHEVSNG